MTGGAIALAGAAARLIEEIRPTRIHDSAAVVSADVAFTAIGVTHWWSVEPNVCAHRIKFCADECRVHSVGFIPACPCWRGILPKNSTVLSREHLPFGIANVS